VSARTQGQLTLLGVCAIWGANFTAIQVALDRLGPIEVALLRSTLAALGFAALLLALRAPLPRLTRGDWGRLLLMGFLQAPVFNLATAAGQAALPASLSSLIVGTSPIFTAILAVALGLETLRPRMVAAIALASAGMAVLVTWGRGTGVELTRETVVGAGILLLGPISWAGYTVLGKPLLVRHPPVQVAGLGTIAGALMLLPLGLRDSGVAARYAAMDGVGWAAIVFSAVGSLVIGSILFNRALRVLTPSETAMSTYVTPLFAVLIAWAALGERPTPGLIAGGALIVAAMAMVMGGGRRR